MVAKWNLSVDPPKIQSRLNEATTPGPLKTATTAARVALALSALLLVVSFLFPYWSLTLHAPQYPGGLDAIVFTNRLAGDVDEIDELNHYIGMMRLGDAAQLERRIAPLALVVLAGLGMAAAVLRPPRASLLALPIVTFPFIFVVDLFYWLYRAGHELDVHAPLSSSIRPFTPAIIGGGQVGQFSTTASFDAGFVLALLSAILAAVGIVLRLRSATVKGGTERHQCIG